MRTEFAYPSCGAGKIHGCRWTPEEPPRAILQIVHGLAEHVLRYDAFARYFNQQGFLVVGEDHMGHGRSIGPENPMGYFTGGWFCAVEDTCALLRRTKAQYPGLPYVLVGHSMGSFMVRTILAKYPELDLGAVVLSGTGWQPRGLLPGAAALCSQICQMTDERKPNPTLENLVFGTYNRKVEHPRTPFDWMTRDQKVVDACMEDPLWGFVATSGLLRDMLNGMMYMEKRENLERMNRKLPVLFVAGGDDPVGNYGKGVRQTVQAFQDAGMEDVTMKIYPLDRHEVFNELNRDEVFADIRSWLKDKL